MPLQLKLRLSTEDDVPFLKALWHTEFGWTEETSECFIEQTFPDSYCIISENYKKPRAALCLIPAYYSGKKNIFGIRRRDRSQVSRHGNNVADNRNDHAVVHRK